MNQKIRPEHQERTAYIYVRHSTERQLGENHQVDQRHVALADRARHFGFKHVVLIDRDVGLPCGEPDDRPGFSKLLSEISQGHVGAVLAFDATRLVRNREEWCRFIDLCAIKNTLYIDTDGVYDPRLAIDRHLLGVEAGVAAEKST